MKRPDYGDATPEDVAQALMRSRNVRLRKGRPKRSDRDASDACTSGDKTENGSTEEPTRQS